MRTTSTPISAVSGCTTLPALVWRCPADQRCLPVTSVTSRRPTRCGERDRTWAETCWWDWWRFHAVSGNQNEFNIPGMVMRGHLLSMKEVRPITSSNDWTFGRHGIQPRHRQWCFEEWPKIDLMRNGLNKSSEGPSSKWDEKIDTFLFPPFLLLIFSLLLL